MLDRVVWVICTGGSVREDSGGIGLGGMLDWA